MNKGSSSAMLDNYPDTIPVDRPLVVVPLDIDPYWVAGFTCAEGCFFANIVKSNTNTGYSVSLRFEVSQDIRDINLMKKIVEFFGFGAVISTNLTLRIL
jgi:hypothetical protein